MIVSLTILRYRRLFIPFALLAMAIHRIPLIMNRTCSFWKLLGCGKNGGFGLQPDWRQWGLLAVWDSQQAFIDFNERSFVSWWWNLFAAERWTTLCVPIASHGKWDGKEPFKIVQDNKYVKGPVAVLTRASIRFDKLKDFWSNVEPVTQIIARAPGYITSFGIGEAPFFRQATFSIWNNLESMKEFAYNSAEHLDVIRKTRQEDWYSEELFARFALISASGTLNGTDPLLGILTDQV